jgi:hypothetical protein
MELRGDPGHGYPDRHCPGCGIGLMASERCSIPGCPESRRRARARAANLDGAEALRQLGGGRISGRAAVEHLDRLDELERRSMDLELLDAYEAALGVRLGGVGHKPGRPS